MGEERRDGIVDSAEETFVQLYVEARREAHRIVGREGPGTSVEATGLMHEAFEHVVRGNRERERLADPQSLLAALTAKMHFLLLDRARRRGAAKRGGGRRREALDLQDVELPELDEAALLSLRQALEELAEAAPDSAALVRWHVYGGLTIAETAAKLGVSRSKADTLWLHARHWLRRRMGED